MGTRGKHDGARGRGSKSDLINFDHKNEASPLKQDVAVRKGGGLFLSPNGVKVEIPPGASTGRRERILCTAMPSTARGILGPWLGPNLRMASDIQLFYSPQNFRIPVALFLPFSYAAARELTYVNDDELGVYITKKYNEGAAKDGTLGDTGQSPEFTTTRVTKNTTKSKHATIQLGKKNATGPALLDTRSVFLLSCKLGEDKWNLVENFTVIQPTVHHINWPPEIKRFAALSARWQDTGYSATSSAETTYANKRLSNVGGTRGRRATATPLRETEPLDQIRRIENYCGGLCVATEELCHCYLIVIGTKAENFLINRDGGFFRSPLLHPFLSVRVPKRSCLLAKLAGFKAIEIRSNWSQAAIQFDSQMTEVEGCSDIYELDLQDVFLRRPAVIRIPLPQWFVDRRSRSHDNWDQNSATLGSSEPQEASAASRTGISDGTYNYERPLMLLYQPSGTKRQIVWQVTNVEDAREDLGRRKSRFQMARKDTLSSERCKIENLYARLGWSYLIVGIRGGQWYTMKQPLYFTKRTAFFETNILGRFVLIGARDPERTPANKLAHLMSRVEALSAAPPGALVIFLQLQPTCWKIMAKLYPEDKLSEGIQEQVNAGYVPIVQMASGPVRRTTSLSNAVIQSTDIIQMFKDSSEAEKSRKPPPIRVNGADINHVLMYNGLCLEFRINGDVRQKPVNQFEPMTQAMKHIKIPEREADQTRPWNKDTTRRDISLSLFGEKPEVVKPDLTTMLTSCAYLQHHELLHETACVFEIEPIFTEEDKFTKRSQDKIQMITEYLRTSAKKQENTSDEYDDDDDDDELESDEDIGRRSSHSDTQVPTAYEGDDGEVDEFLREAQEQALRNQPLSTTTINSELLRRLNNIMEKSKMNRAGEFLQKVHDMFHVGTLEVWLVSPQLLPQLALPTKPKVTDTSKDSTSSQLPSEQDSQSKTSKFESTTAPKVSEGADEVMDETNDQEAHNAIRWNPVEATGNADGGRSVMFPDMLKNPSKPLAVYNLLVDPDLVLGYAKSPLGKTGSASMVHKKPTRGKSPTKKGDTKQVKQNNASVESKVKRSISTPTVKEQFRSLTEDTDETCSINSDLMRMVAGRIHDPKKLATALGVTDMDFEGITAKYHDVEANLASISFEVMRTWNARWSGQNHQTGKHDVQGDSGVRTETMRSPLTDLADVLQSIGCFDGVELIRKIEIKQTR